MPRSPVTWLFLTLIVAPPLGQAGWELARGGPVQALDVIGPVREARLRAFEKDLRDASFVYEHVTPWYQWALLHGLGFGNEKTVVGNDGWLYFSENLDYMSRPAFGDAGRHAILDSIDDFGRQLAEQGIPLVVVPAPAKVEVEPRHLSRLTAHLRHAVRPSTRAFMSLVAHGPHWTTVWEPDSWTELAYLPRDTHWTPECMQAVAGDVAALVRAALDEHGLELTQRASWRTESARVEAAGDLTGMLRLPSGEQAFAPMELSLERVVSAEDGAPFAPRRDAEVLLLGDSFTLAFSDERIGLGGHAGLAEHLALELGAPLDVIALAGGSARAVRETLARREEGLTGKKVVVWQLSVRDFAGDPAKWTTVELPPPQPVAEPAAEPASPGEAEDGGGLRVRAEIAEVTYIPAEFDYEFCLAIHEYRVLEVLAGSLEDGPLWVAHVAIDEFEPTAHAAYEVGQRHVLELEDVVDHHDLEETSWMDNTDSDPRAVIWFPTLIEEAD